MKIRRNKKLLILAVVLLLLAAFVLALFHSHPDGQHLDCPVCRLVRQIFFLVVLAAVAFMTDLAGQSHIPAQISFFKPLLLPSNLQGRAPPSLLV